MERVRRSYQTLGSHAAKFSNKPIVTDHALVMNVRIHPVRTNTGCAVILQLARLLRPQWYHQAILAGGLELVNLDTDDLAIFKGALRRVYAPIRRSLA
ncbi:hypothetical protein DI396_14180 [Litorivita pollutaquae]|uniref:Uncharacterized protein n=1 Tax=Litorivita pollutaquae TaxID=2200892 RepID=A0A2V4MR98_9RHOB|nr:hypothetical protein DI396_14180 [Litorivita pollutaquae]